MIEHSRPHRGVILDCCSVYIRVYLSDDGDQFVGRCPKCGCAVEIADGKERVDRRSLLPR